MEPLMHFNKTMDFGKHPYQIARMWQLAGSDAMPIVINLEPGDGTRYTVMLTPCWSLYVAPNLAHFGIQYTEARNYIIVTRLNDTDGTSGYSYRYNDFIEAQMATSPWTQKILEYFMCLVWEELEK